MRGQTATQIGGDWETFIAVCTTRRSVLSITTTPKKLGRIAGPLTCVRIAIAVLMFLGLPASRIGCSEVVKKGSTSKGRGVRVAPIFEEIGSGARGGVTRPIGLPRPAERVRLCPFRRQRPRGPAESAAFTGPVYGPDKRNGGTVRGVN